MMEVCDVDKPAVSDFNLFAASETGILKCVSINPKANLLKNFSHDSGPLDRQREITCLEWGNEEESELLIGMRSQTVKVFDIADKCFTKSSFCQVGDGPIRGVAKHNEVLVTASESGYVRLWKTKKEEQLSFDAIDVELESSGKLRSGGFETEEQREKHLVQLKAGRNLAKMRQIPSAPNMIATGGKENRLQIWDLSRPDAQPVFAAKNVKPDMLQLRVPVWVTDICFPDLDSPNLISTVSRYGHIRLYDTRSNQRRPVQDLTWTDEALTATSATGNKNQILVGSGAGSLALFDFRAQHKGMFRKYKGCVGSVRSIHGLRDKPYFAVAGLDRFVRIFNINQQKSVQKMYLKARLNGVLLSSAFDPEAMVVDTPVVGKKSQKAIEDMRPDVEVVGEQDDERFWAKIPVIREKKKRPGQKEKPIPAKVTKKLKK